MALEQDLDLVIDPALSAIDQIGAALTSLATQFEADLADALAVLSETADEQVTLTVDTQGADEAQAELEATSGAAEEVDGQSVVIEVDAAGTEEAAAALEGIAADSEAATAAAALVGSSLDDLGGKAQGSAAALAATSLALGGVTLGLGELFLGSLEAQAGQDSFAARTGDAAEQVETLTGASSELAGSLGELALALGSDDEELRSAVARIFALGEAEGFATDRSDELIENIVAIAARARALNPELGSLGEIANTLGTRLQRGGRFTADFGLSLTAAEIQARAMQNTGRRLASELTLLEKTEAAAQLATEQLGGALGADISENADNAAITFDRLKTGIAEALEPVGAPLIEQVFAILEAGQPIIEDVGRILVDLGLGVTGVLIPALQIATPLIELIANTIDAIPGPVLTAIAAFIAFRQVQPVLQGVADSLRAVQSGAQLSAALGGATARTTALAKGAGTAAAGVSGLASALPLVGIGAGLFIGHLQEADAQRRRFEQGVQQLAKRMREIGVKEAFDEVVRDALAGSDLLLDRLDDLGVSSDELVAALTGGPEEFERLASRVTSTLDGFDVDRVRGELELARRAFFESAEASEHLNNVLSETPEVVDDTGSSIGDLGLAADGAKVGVASLLSAFSTGAGFVAEAGEKIREFVATGVEQIPRVTEVVADMEEGFQASPDAIIAALQENEEAIGNFQSNVRALLAFGLDDLARLAIEKGPEFTNALVDTFRVGRPLLAQELEAQLEGAQTQLDALPQFFEDIAPQLGVSAASLGREASEQFGGGLTFGQEVEEETARTVDAILRAGPNLSLEAGGAGAQTTEGYGDNLDLPGATQQSADEAQALMASLGLTGSPLFDAATTSGELIGTAFAIALGNAIVDAAAPDGFLNLQVQSAIDDLTATVGDKFKFDLSTSVAGTPATPTGRGDFIINLEPGAVQVSTSGGDRAALTSDVTRATQEGIVAAGRMLITEVMAR